MSTELIYVLIYYRHESLDTFTWFKWLERVFELVTGFIRLLQLVTARWVIALSLFHTLFTIHYNTH
jgi:hypothetical protein